MTYPILMKLATDRTDKGETAAYRVYSGGGQVQLKNPRGENVIKNAILGGNGIIYVAKELAGTHDEFVLMPRVVYEQQLAAARKEGKKK